MASVVFDASAILALLRDEPGADVVAHHVGDGMISAVNFQEVVKELLRNGIVILVGDGFHGAVYQVGIFIGTAQWVSYLLQIACSIVSIGISPGR